MINATIPRTSLSFFFEERGKTKARNKTKGLSIHSVIAHKAIVFSKNDNFLFFRNLVMYTKEINHIVRNTPRMWQTHTIRKGCI